MLSFQQNGMIVINKPCKIDKLKKPDGQNYFPSHRALGQSIGVCTRPDVFANINLIAPGGGETTGKEFKIFNKTIYNLRKTKEIGFSSKKFDIDTMRLVFITDASFANAKQLRSQIGFGILMADGNGTANLIHFGSSRCRRVTIRILAAGINA